MNINCHFVYGAAVGSMLALNIATVSNAIPNITNTPETATLFVLGGVLGGIFPDIDNPSSHMGSLSAPVSTIIGKINEKLGKVGSNHRGILHDPTVYIAGLILSYLFFTPLIGFFIGCLSHLFLDMFNPKGILHTQVNIVLPISPLLKLPKRTFLNKKNGIICITIGVIGKVTL